MRNIEELYLEETYFEVFEKVISFKKDIKPTKKLKWNKNRTILNALKEEIKECYKKYNLQNSELFPMIHKWFVWDNKNALLHCYKNDSVYSKIIKENIKKLGNKKCPYCNIEGASQVEHYLPEEDFPEFAFLVQNLIPSCWTCNSKKWDRWKDDDTRLFLNAFFDLIPKEQFLFIELGIEKSTIYSKFKIDVSNININKTVYIILEKHVKKLSLLERYSLSINEVISELKSANPKNVEDLKMIIQYSIRIWNWYWNNYWKNILYKEISENEKILNFIIK